MAECPNFPGEGGSWLSQSHTSHDRSYVNNPTHHLFHSVLVRSCCYVRQSSAPNSDQPRQAAAFPRSGCERSLPQCTYRRFPSCRPLTSETCPVVLNRPPRNVVIFITLAIHHLALSIVSIGSGTRPPPSSVSLARQIELRLRASLHFTQNQTRMLTRG